MEAYVYEKYDYVIAKGKTTEQAKKEVFEDILIDYLDMMTSDTGNLLFGLKKEILKLHSDIYILNKVLGAYLINRDAGLKRMMSQLGFHFKSESKVSQIMFAYESYNKYLELELKSTEASLEKLSKNEQDQKVSRDSFLQNIALLHKFNGAYIDKRNISLEDYCYMINALKEHIEQLEKQKTKYA